MDVRLLCLTIRNKVGIIIITRGRVIVVAKGSDPQSSREMVTGDQHEAAVDSPCHWFRLGYLEAQPEARIHVQVLQGGNNFQGCL